MFGLIGVAIFAFGVYRWWSRRVPANALRLSGTVVDVRERRSTVTSRRILFGPVIAYQHPTTGQRELLEPTGFTPRKPRTGDTVAIAYDRGRERVRIVQPARQLLALPAIGAVMCIVQIASWTS